MHAVISFVVIVEQALCNLRHLMRRHFMHTSPGNLLHEERLSQVKSHEARAEICCMRKGCCRLNCMKQGLKSVVTRSHALRSLQPHIIHFQASVANLKASVHTFTISQLTLGEPAKPMHSAHTRDDLPVPVWELVVFRVSCVRQGRRSLRHVSSSSVKGQRTIWAQDQIELWPRVDHHSACIGLFTRRGTGVVCGSLAEVCL
jgi:hypothetical protein